MTSPLREMAAAAARWRAATTRSGSRPPRTTRSATSPGRSTRWPPSSPRPTACGATSSPTCPTSCARRSPRCRPCSRTSSTAWPSPIPRRSARCSPRSSGSAGSCSSSSTSPASNPAWCRSTARPFRVEPMLEHAVREQRLHEPEVAVRDARSSPPTCSLDGDPERVHQVVANLLENAVRHTPHGGIVEVRAAPQRPRRHDRGARRRAGHPRSRPGPRVRALLPRRRGTVVERRRRRPRPRDRPVDRRPARRRHPPRAPRAARLPHGRGSCPADPKHVRPNPTQTNREPTHEPGHDRRRAQAHPPRRDGPRRRRRGPRERGRPHDGGELGDTRGGELHAAVGTRAGVHACAPEVLDELDFGPMVPPEIAGCDTAFTVSIDHVDAGSGIGAADRAITIRQVVDPDASPTEFKRPGHVFPLRARTGGVLERRGHTEAAVDLAVLAGLPPVAVICEVLNDDGSPASFAPRGVRRPSPHRDDVGRPDRRAPHEPDRPPRPGAAAPLEVQSGGSPISRRAAAIAVRSRRAVSGARCATMPTPACPASSTVSTTRSSPSPHASQSSLSATAHDAGGRSSSSSGWSSSASSIASPHARDSSEQ